MSEIKELLSQLPQGELVDDPVIIIPSFDNGPYIENFIRQLLELKLERYLVFDGGSTDPITINFLKELREKRRVLVLPENPGPRHFFESKEIFDSLPEIFCVSDPDLSFNKKMPRDFLKSLHAISVEFSMGKVGLALELESDLIDDEFFFYGEWHSIKSWEGKYWTQPVSNSLNLEVFRAEIDTTFALYNKENLKNANFFEGLRVGGSFSATHLPWLKDNPLANSLSKTQGAADPRWSTWSQANSISNLRKINEQNEHKLRAIETSLSWKITQPLRRIGRLFQR